MPRWHAVRAPPHALQRTMPWTLPRHDRHHDPARRRARRRCDPHNLRATGGLQEHAAASVSIVREMAATARTHSRTGRESRRRSRWRGGRLSCPAYRTESAAPSCGRARHDGRCGASRARHRQPSARGRDRPRRELAQRHAYRADRVRRQTERRSRSTKSTLFASKANARLRAARRRVCIGVSHGAARVAAVEPSVPCLIFIREFVRFQAGACIVSSSDLPAVATGARRVFPPSSFQRNPLR
ncbi:hypothetical protein UA19_03319 [Burkholderia multivorans]|nr:putative acetyltransferase domain protein [Burkholderia multivorans ATCC BAA-247]SAJ94123.1 hypothetical protein UA19_03319 [Burkholderia multivorans]SAK23967.1 hypothetical protein UA21_03099 [Burkholderia multivorans]SPU87882.1 Uncharacterised protein [Burkholderia multivorans]